MEKTLVLAHIEEDGFVGKSALEAISAAKSLSEQFDIGLIGAGSTSSAAKQIGGAGAQKILAVSGEEFAQSRFSTDAAAAEALCRASGAELIIAPATTRFNRVLAAVAHRLSGRVDMHVTGISRETDTIQISRWYYRQRMEAKIIRQHRPWCIALESTCFEPYAGAPTEQQVELIDCKLSAELLNTSVIGFEKPVSEMQTIQPDASLLFVAGAGWTKKQQDGKVHADIATSLILGFLEQSKASLGGSKSVVDLGSEGQAVLPFMSHLNQIGQTGSTPRHQKGLSTCCHGEEPHVVGWRFITERRAINLDVNCSWAQGKCDVLYVGDAFKIMERVNEILKQRAKPMTALSS